MREGFPGKAAVGLAGAALALTTLLAVTLFTLDRVKYAAIAFARSGEPLWEFPGLLLRTLTPADYLAIAAAVFGLWALVRLERRTNALSQGLAAAPRPWFQLLLVVLLVWCSQAFLYPGKLIAGDTLFHVSRISFVAARLHDGEPWYWNNLWHVGVPVMQFTGPLLFWVGGGLAGLLGDPHVATKALLFVCQFGSGLAVYLFLRRLGLMPLPALIGAVGYAGAWTHLHTLLYKGALPQAITFLLLPLGMLAVHAVASGRAMLQPAWVGLALVGAALLVNHPTNGLFAGIYIALFVALGLLFGEFRWRRVLPLTLAALAAVVMTLFVVVPTRLESGMTTLVINEEGLVNFVWPGLDYFGRLFTWSIGNTGTGANFDAYVGFSLVLLAVAGLFQAVARGGAATSARVTRILILLLVLSFVMRGPHIRSNVFTLLFLSLLAGVGAQKILTWAGARPWAPAALLALVFLDLGPGAVQPLARTDKQYFDVAAQRLMTDPVPGRVLTTSSYTGSLRVSLWANPFMEYPVAQTGLPFGYSTTRYHNFGAVAFKSVERDLRLYHRLQPATIEQLAIADVTRIANDTGADFGLPPWVEGTVPEPELGAVLRIDASPVIVAERLVELVPADGLEVPVFWNESFDGDGSEMTRAAAEFVTRVLTDTGLSEDLRRARALAVRQRPADWLDQTNATPLSASLDQYQITSGSVRVTLTASGDGYAQISQGWYPTQRVLHNGLPITPARGSLDLLVVPVRAGVNTYEILPSYTSLRRAMNWISLSGLLVVVVAGGWSLWGGSLRRVSDTAAR